MLRVGLTGGIASGKSSVAKWFMDKGVPVFDADKSIHENYTNPVVISKIKELLGAEYVQDASINRPLLSRAAFNDAQLKKELEKIFHPLVLEDMDNLCKELELQKKKFVILDIPLLYEVGWEKFVDQIWVVFVPFDIQVKRLMSRNGFSEIEAKQRIFAQLPLVQKAEKADRVIDNAGSWNQTEQQLDILFQEIGMEI